jgi:Glutaminase
MRSSLKHFLTVFLLLGFSAIAALAQVEAAEPPPFISILEFGEYGRGFAPSQATLTPQEEKIFHDYVTALKFPNYLFSGCHDRAHAAWMMMPAALKDKVSKIWVVAASKHSASARGIIKLMPNIPGSVDVRWGYHVALAYKDEEGLQIYDAGIAQGKVLDAETWFAALKPDPLTFWTMTAGRIYLFYNTSAPFSTNKEIWGGNAHEYTGQSAAENWIPVALARDAVGEAILQRRECEVIKTEAKDPNTLLERLKKGDVPQGCEKLLDIYKTEKQRWIDKLK